MKRKESFYERWIRDKDVPDTDMTETFYENYKEEYNTIGGDE